MRSERTATCVTCTFWDPNAATDKTTGKCRVRAPRFVNKDTGMVHHGYTRSTDWCGEWEKHR